MGTIGRPHGLRGDVVVHLVSNRDERLAPGSSLVCSGRPLVVTSSQPVPGKAGAHGTQWLVHFQGVDDRSAAEALVSGLLEAEPGPSGDGLWVHELIGATVVGPDGEDRGTVVAMEANPASDLLVLSTGALVPLRFVAGRDRGVVRVDTPPGLFEL